MKKYYSGMLIPYEWYFELVNDLGKPQPDEELGQKRLWTLFMSLRKGEQVMTGDVKVDYPVSSLLLQSQKMRKEVLGQDLEIATMRGEGKTSKEIGAILGMSDGSVRKTDGWINYQKYIKGEEEHRIIGNDKFNF